MPQIEGPLTPTDVLDERMAAFAATLKAAQQSMHASWRRSGLYYGRIDALEHVAGDEARPFIMATKLAGIAVHLGRATDAVRSTPRRDDALDEVAHNLVDMMLGILDLAEYLGADLGQQLMEQLTAAAEHFAAGGREPKQF